MSPQILGVMIPIIAIVLGIGLAIVSVIANHLQRLQRSELRHRERLAAIEKGLELPPDPPEPGPDPARQRSRDLLRGLVLLFVGVTVTAALLSSPDADGHYLWGLVPAGVGIAYLLFYFIESRRVAAGARATPPR